MYMYMNTIDGYQNKLLGVTIPKRVSSDNKANCFLFYFLIGYMFLILIMAFSKPLKLYVNNMRVLKN